MKKKSFHLSIEALESREVPATLAFGYPGGDIFPGHGDVLDPSTAGAITLNEYGRVTAMGTESADIIRIDPHKFVATENVFTFDAGGGNDLLGEAIRVRVMDAAGVVRLDGLGIPLDRYFLTKDVYQVDVYALGGDDQVSNASTTRMVANGGEGNDSLTAGASTDRDMLLGEGGNDRLIGSAAGDLMYGGANDDTLSGEGGDDDLNGGDGIDSLFGGPGNDTVSGGAGADHLSGDADADTLRGNEDNDVLVGGPGNDDLYGGSEHDELRGEAGNDGLFGGAGQDVMSGGSGIDRFLRWKKSGNNATITDRAGNESLTTFKGTGEHLEKLFTTAPLRYEAGEWTEGEIESVDAGMAFLHAETGNTKLLRLKGGSELTMLRYGSYIPYNATDGLGDDAAEAKANDKGAGWAGRTSGDGEIDFMEPSTATAIHEIAHNWENENPRWKEWLSLSGWRRHITAPRTDEVLSRDGKWIFRASKLDAFAGDVQADGIVYGRTNPYEDFATMFEEYYDVRSGRSRRTTEQLASWGTKLIFIEQFTASLR